MIRIIPVLAFTCLGLSGCFRIQGMPFPRELIDQGPANSAVELQALQTREYEADKKRLMATIVTVFQDEGYLVSQTDFDIGMVMATAPEETRGIKAVGVDPDSTAFKLKYEYSDVKPTMSIVKSPTLTTKRSFSALVTELSPSRSKVRLTIVVRGEISLAGFNSHEDTDTSADRYQRLFSKLQQALFLKSNTE
jgi:hypothetical protein